MAGQKGMTLIEVMVTVIIAAIVLAAVYTTFLTQYKSYIAQSYVTEMQQNGRVALEAVTKSLRMAGYGVTSTTANATKAFFFGTDTNCTWFPGSTSSTIAIASRNPAMKSTLQSDGVTLNTALTMSVGTILFVQSSNSSMAGFVMNKSCPSPPSCTQTSIDRYATSCLYNDAAALGGNYGNGTAYGVNYSYFSIITTTTGVPVLYVWDGTFKDSIGSGGIKNIRPIATNIEALTFTYLDGNNGNLDPLISTNQDSVRKVIVEITARTSKKDPDINDYRRRKFSEDVLIRNMYSLNPNFNF